MNPPRKTSAAARFGLRFLFRLLGWSMSAAVALVVLLYVAMPAALRFGIPRVLSGYGITSSIESARVDISEEKVTLVGFNIGPDNGPGIRWGEVVALVDMSALLKGNIRIIDIQVKDARVDLQQLAAARWDASLGGSAGGEKTAQFDVGEAAIRDLELIGLSEKLGRPVSIKSLKVGSVSQLNQGEQVAFELEAAMGDAGLRLVGIAMVQGDLPVVEGRYELRAFALNGLAAAFKLAGQGTVEGRTDGAGTFKVRYQPEGASVKLTVSGRLGVTDLALESPLVMLTDAGVEWDGAVDLDWPVGGALPSVKVDGRASARRVVAEYRNGVEPVRFEATGLGWNGQTRFEQSLSMTGRIEADSVQLKGGSSKGAWRVDSGGVAVDAVREAEAGDFRIRALTAGDTSVFLTTGGVEHAAALASVSLVNLRAGRDGYTIETIDLDSAQSGVSDAAQAVDWKVTGLSSRGVGISNDGRLAIETLDLDQGQFGFSGTNVSLSGARADRIEGSAGANWAIAELNATSVRHVKNESEIWGNGIALAGGQWTPGGGIAIDTLGAEQITQSSSNKLDWEIRSLETDGVSATGSALRADKASASSFSHRVGETGEIEITAGELSDVSYDQDVAARASRLQFGELRYRGGEIQAVQLTGAAAVDPAYHMDGRFSAGGVDVKQFQVTDSAANMSQFETISASGIEGNVDSGVRVETVSVHRWRHDGAANVDMDGRILRLDNLDAQYDGTIRTRNAELDGLTVHLPEGMELLLTGLAVEQTELRSTGVSLAANGASARELSLRRGDNQRLSVQDVEAGRLTPAPGGGHTLSFLRASRTEAMDDVIGTRLEAGSVSMEKLRESASGRIDVGSGTFQAVSLADTRGTPAASFSAKVVKVEDGGFETGKLIDLGRIRIEDANTVSGFSEFSRFVLPKAPFSGGDQESDVELAITRLETHGNGTLSFFDRSTTPAFELTLSPFAARLENYRSGNPAERAQFAIEGTIDEFSSLKVNGSVSDKPEGIDLKVEGKVSAFDLTRLNTYAAKHAGRAIQAGRGDANFDIKIDGQKVSGDTQFVFSNVKFGPAKTASSSGQGQDISLDGAFAMLKDKNEVVKVSVPLSGSLDDPQFDFSDAVTQAVIKTVQKTVMLTFKPLGLLASVAGLVGVGSGLRFNPVPFDAGGASLTGQGLSYLDTLARELERHPKVKLRICGRAVPADLIARDKAGASGNLGATSEPPAGQVELAGSRATAVRQYLEQKKGIASSRLLECPPEVETTAGSLPRTEMLVHVNGETDSAPVQPKAKGTVN